MRVRRAAPLNARLIYVCLFGVAGGRAHTHMHTLSGAHISVNFETNVRHGARVYESARYAQYLCVRLHVCASRSSGVRHNDGPIVDGSGGGRLHEIINWKGLCAHDKS